MAPWPYPRWIAHRGAGKLVPENTMAAFRYGAERGYRMFECDAKLSNDGVVFLLHDATLDRTTNGRGIAGDRDWADLAQLDAGGWHSRAYAGEPLPTMANLARFCLANGHLLDIEIKPTPGAEARTGEAVAREAAMLWKNAGIPPFLTSFEGKSLQAARAVAPQLPRGYLFDALEEGWLDKAKALDCAAIVFNHNVWDPALVMQTKQAGMRCLSYTVNDQWAARRLVDLGTDGIVTDRVDLFAPAA